MLIDEDTGEYLYEVHWKLLNSMTHGIVPQSRPRVYIVGLLKKEMRSPFQWPERVACARMVDILGVNTGGAAELLALSDTKLRHIGKLTAEYASMEPKPDIILNCGGTSATTTRGYIGTITATRSADLAFYSLKRNRMLTNTELLKLQGFDVDWFHGWQKWISTRQFNHAIGNAMTCTLLARIIEKAFNSLGFDVKPMPGV